MTPISPMPALLDDTTTHTTNGSTPLRSKDEGKRPGSQCCSSEDTHERKGQRPLRRTACRRFRGTEVLGPNAKWV